MDIPLLGLAAFPIVWAAIFPRFAGAKPEEVPRSIRKNRRLPPKPPMLLRVSFVTLSAMPATMLRLKPQRDICPGRGAALAVSRSRPGFYLRHCRVSRK